MKLDVFNHIFPKKFYDRMLKVAPNGKDMHKRVREIPCIVDLDARFRIMDKFGEDYAQVATIGAGTALKQRLRLRPYKLLHPLPPPHMPAMAAPGANDLVGPHHAVKNRLVILRPDRIGLRAHQQRIGCAIGKDIGHCKRAKSQRPRPTFTAFNRWIVLDFGGC